MKTTVKTVTVEVTDNGRSRYLNYRIATRDGTLMTHRLERLLSGRLGRGYGNWFDEHGIGADMHEIHYVGMVWRPPYQLLRELMQDRVELQRELYKLEGAFFTIDVPTRSIPTKADNDYISKMVMDELRERKAIKADIRELDKITDAERERISINKSEGSWKPILPTMPTPYSW